MAPLIFLASLLLFSFASVSAAVGFPAVYGITVVTHGVTAVDGVPAIAGILLLLVCLTTDVGGCCCWH
jgi:hypothetical protein